MRGAHTGAMPVIPPDEDEVIYARRLVAQKCLYGIDRNPMAVDLAKVSLWLSTLARDHPLTFVDHALRHGDSLVGLTRRQIEALHWKGGTSVLTGFGVHEAVAAASKRRRQIREADDTVDERQLQNLWRDAREAQADVRLFGDLVLAAFFEGLKPKERESRRLAYQEAILTQRARPHAVEMEERRNAEIPFAPFHWEIEFPEVFERDNPGFDGFVGNPPFLGGKRISTINGGPYRDWLAAIHDESSSNTDIIAHFFRRTFTLIRSGGALGLVATNSIAQGDTRSGGLRWICEHGGEIYRATKRIKWPGDAAVVVSVLNISKGKTAIDKVLDGTSVNDITAFLFHRGGHREPQRLAVNDGKSYVGMFLRGMGFTFDDKDKKEVASSLSEMERIVAKNPSNRQVIFPYIGGEEVNSSPTHAHHRYAINFGAAPLRREGSLRSWSRMLDEDRRQCLRQGLIPLDYPGRVAADLPDVLAIVEAKVKPSRESLSSSAIDRSHRRKWWLYANTRPELSMAIAGLERVLVTSRIGNSFAFTFLPAGTICNEKIVVFPFTRTAPFAVLQSRVHEIWARFFSSTLKDDLQYTPSDCFETFPFPEGWETHPALEAAGNTYHGFRAMLMVDKNEGLTKTYNRFHDIYESVPAVIELRELHAAMDRAVLCSYGWTDIPTNCEFLLDYEIDEATWGRKKKPYRYRWPDTVRDEVLARLLALNAERAAAESRADFLDRLPTRRAPSYEETDSPRSAKVAEPRSGYATTKG